MTQAKRTGGKPVGFFERYRTQILAPLLILAIAAAGLVLFTDSGAGLKKEVASRFQMFRYIGF